MPVRILALFILCVLSIVAVSSLAETPKQTLSQRQSEIIRLVGGREGYLTQELHKEFWNEFPADIVGNNRKKMRLAIDLAYLPQVYIEFERELWNSAKLSLDKGVAVSTPTYQSAKDRLSLFIDTAVFEAPTFAAVAEEADNILHAAASGNPYQSAQGTASVDAALIDSVLAGLDAAQSRLERLFAPDYPDQPMEWKYPEGHFRVFWPDPFVESRAAIPQGGYGREVVIYSSRYDENTYLSVQFISLFKPESDPVRALLYGKLVASQMGFPTAEGSLSEWEGHPAALIKAVAVLEDKPVELSLRLILAPEHEGAWALLAIGRAEEAPNLAEALRDNLDRAVRPE